MTQVEDGCATLADIEPHPRPFFKINSVASKGSVFGERLLPMDKIINFRDLGGYETIDGKRVQWGKVFRSANLGRSSENDLNFLKSLGIRLVCDLRLAKEMAKRPDRLPEGVRFLHIPAAEEDPVNAKKILFNSQHLEDIFLHGYYKSQLIDDGAKVFGRLIKLVSNTANLPLVLHCNAGKDRAGIAAALILLAIGVPEKTVVEDYTLSNLNVEYMLRSVAHNYRHMRWFRLRVEHFYPLIATPPRMMENSIKHIHERYGSIERYLLNAAGLENQDLRNLRQNLLEA
jgi:protein-tyrosine phosphatase